MKRNRIFAVLSFLAMGMAITSCNKEETPVSKEDMDNARAFVLALKQGENAYNGLAFKTSFKQQYDIAYVDENENAKTSYNYDYDAEGSVTMAYRLDANAMFDFGKCFDEGGCYLTGDQQEIAKLTSTTTAKGEFGKDDRSFQEDYAFHHTFGIQFDPSDFYAQGAHDLTDRIVPDNDGSGSFQGHIARSCIEDVAAKAIKSSIDRILYMNAWQEVTSFRVAMDDYFAGLDLTSDKLASEFNRHHKITFAEHNGILHAEFSFDAGEVFSAIGGKKADINASIQGKVDIDQANHRVTSYSFDFKDAYASMIEKQLSNKQSHSLNIKTFILTGALEDCRYEDLHLSGNFVDYTSEQVDAFIEGYTAHVIPNIGSVSH